MKCLLLLALTSLSVAACSGSEGPDKVVGSLLKCDVPTRISANTYSKVATEGSACDGVDGARKELTIRTSNGSTYKVTVPLNQRNGLIGDRWPP